MAAQSFPKHGNHSFIGWFIKFLEYLWCSRKGRDTKMLKSYVLIPSLWLWIWVGAKSTEILGRSKSFLALVIRKGVSNGLEEWVGFHQVEILAPTWRKAGSTACTKGMLCNGSDAQPSPRGVQALHGANLPIWSNDQSSSSVSSSRLS